MTISLHSATCAQLAKVDEQEWRCLYCHSRAPTMPVSASELELGVHTTFEDSPCRKCGYNGFALVASKVPWWRRRAVLRRRLAHKLVAALKANT